MLAASANYAFEITLHTYAIRSDVQGSSNQLAQVPGSAFFWGGREGGTINNSTPVGQATCPWTERPWISNPQEANIRFVTGLAMTYRAAPASVGCKKMLEMLEMCVCTIVRDGVGNVDKVW